MKDFFVDYWKGGSRLSKEYMSKHWKGVVLLNAGLIIIITIGAFHNQINTWIKTKFNKRRD